MEPTALTGEKKKSHKTKVKFQWCAIKWWKKYAYFYDFQWIYPNLINFVDPVVLIFETPACFSYYKASSPTVAQHQVNQAIFGQKSKCRTQFSEPSQMGITLYTHENLHPLSPTLTQEEINPCSGII